MDPTSFFSSKTVNQVKSNLVKAPIKKIAEKVDYEFDEMDFDDNIIEILDSTGDKVLSVLTEKNTSGSKGGKHNSPKKSVASPCVSPPNADQPKTAVAAAKKESPVKVTKPKIPVKQVVATANKSLKCEEIAIPSKRSAEGVAEKREPTAKQAR